MASLAILIDGGYLDKVAQEEFHVRVDYRALSEAIQGIVRSSEDEPVRLFRTYYYTALPFRSEPPTPEEASRYARAARFIERLRRLPRFEVRLGRLVLRGTDEAGRLNLEQKQVDVQIASDIVRLSAKQVVTHFAIITGDSDLIPAVAMAREEGVSIWLFHGPYRSAVSGYSNELWDLVDMRHEIDQAFMNQVQRRRP